MIDSIDANDVFSFVSEEAKTLYGGCLAPQTKKSAGIDLIVTGLEVKENIRGQISLVIVKTGLRLNPEFDEPSLRVEIHSRSSLYKNSGLFMANSVGIVDNDYKGEIMCQLIPNDGGYIILPVVGERVAQATLVLTVPWSAKDAKNRAGGFGSTGTS